jgi:hypothetical protein
LRYASAYVTIAKLSKRGGLRSDSKKKHRNLASRGRPNKVHLCSHAEEKAKERNIDEQDIKRTLYYPDRTRPTKKRYRTKAEKAFNSGAYKIQVVYSIEEDQFGPMFNVITVMKIKRKGGRR